MSDLFTKFKKYIVYADSLQDFIDKYHKPGKINDFNREADFKGHKDDILKYGFTIIPHHDSITGELVSYYGKI